MPKRNKKTRKSKKSRSSLLTIIGFIIVAILVGIIIKYKIYQPTDAASTTAAALSTTFSQQLTSYKAAKTPAQQTAALSALRTTAKSRKAAMLKLTATPATFLQNVLPLTVRQSVPAQLFNEGLIEQDAAFSGKLYIGHVEVKNAKKSTPQYNFIYTSGTVSQGAVPKVKNYILYPTKQPATKTHALLTVKGYVYPGVMVADSANTTNFKIGSAIKPSFVPNTTGKVLVLLINYIGNPSEPYSQATIQRELFDIGNTQSVYNYYQEVSGAKFTFTGEVRGWVRLSQTETGCDLNYNEMSQQARDALGINPTDYTAIGYVFPVPTGCSTRGWASVGTAEWWNVTNEVDEVRGYAVHEYGHLFGNVHANFISCGSSMILPNYATACTNIEYLDYYDPMGANIKPLRHYSGIVKFDLNWLKPGEYKRVTTTGNYSLVPVELYNSTRSVGTKVIQIWKQGTGEYYEIEYRTRTGFDNHTAFPANGSIFVRLAGSNYDSIGTSYATHSLIIDTHPGDAPAGSTVNDAVNVMMGVNEQFVDPGNNITVRVTSMTPQQAQLQITTNLSCAVEGQGCGGGIAGIQRDCCSGLMCTPPDRMHPDALYTCQPRTR